MPIKTTILAASLTLLAGCANTAVFVLDQKEIVRVKAGQSYTATYDGWLLSERAVDRVMNAKIKRSGLE